MNRPPVYDETREVVRSVLCLLCCAPILACAFMIADLLR